MINDTAKHMANSMGLASVLINVRADGKPIVSLNEYANKQRDPEVLQQMARILCAMTLDEDDE